MGRRPLGEMGKSYSRVKKTVIFGHFWAFLLKWVKVGPFFSKMKKDKRVLRGGVNVEEVPLYKNSPANVVGTYGKLVEFYKKRKM